MILNERNEGPNEKRNKGMKEQRNKRENLKKVLRKAGM